MKAAAVVERIGRFELVRELGRGAQAIVWLAHDPRLERDVALKVLHQRADDDTMNRWLHEARAVSRLNHPHIVPVFEADAHDGRPYMVFEHVSGGTLADKLRSAGALPAHEAAELTLGVLDALQCAHEAGVVHRDLKPTNILLDGLGRARVMDFGIAARVGRNGEAGAAHDGAIVGTPGYMSPEAARGEAPAPTMDVFAAGVMLAEMLSGKPVRPRERDPWRAVQRAADEAIALNAVLDERTDDRLRQLVATALEHDSARRTPSARVLRDGLARWLEPAAPPEALGPRQGALDFLLRRMRHKADFPALGDSVARINRVATSDSEGLASLVDVILQDVALTNKLLRLVNTASFMHAGGGSISTVSRAVALIGFAGTRNLALSLVLLEHMHDKAHAQELTQEFLRALMAGTLARELAASPRAAEEAFIGAMFQNLGRMLTGYYFPEEARQIRAHAAKIGEATAAQRVLGLNYAELGVGVARSWGLPESLQRCMRRPDGEPPLRPIERPLERQRCLGAAANDIADAVLHAGPADAPTRVRETAERYAKAIGANGKDIEAAVGAARERMTQLVAGMALSLPAGAQARRLLASAEPATAAPQADDVLAQHELQATLPAPIDIAACAVAPERAADVLAAGIADITNSMVSEGFRLNEVLRMILETMYRGLGFQRVVFCLRDPKTDTLSGRFGLGTGAETVSNAFRVPLLRAAATQPQQGADLFSAVCAKGADTLISDAHAPAIQQRLPQWYRSKVNAGSFLLLPLAMKNAPLALIYADRERPGALALGDKELSLLRTLRNQAVMAFRQAA